MAERSTDQDKELKEDKSVEQVAAPAVPTSPSRRTLLIALSIGGVVVMIIISAAIIIALHALRFGSYNGTMRPMGATGNTFNGSDGSNQQQMMPRGGRSGNGGFFGPRASSGDTRLEGVILSINGDTFVLAGNGKQTTIKKTDSTTFRTSDNAPAVNDTVMVVGTVGSDGVLTATTIALYGASSTN